MSWPVLGWGQQHEWGSKAGVAEKLLNDEPRSLFIHCYDHALNLAAGNAIKCKVSFCNFHAGERVGLRELAEETSISMHLLNFIVFVRWKRHYSVSVYEKPFLENVLPWNLTLTH